MNKAFDTEAYFDAFVIAYGGLVLKNAIAKSPAFDNADYIFHKHQIVAELKCLERDKLEDPDFGAKVERCLAKWPGSAKLPMSGSMELRGDVIPTEVFSELRKIYISPLQRVIKKANKQIRETKQHLGLSNYKGLLLLANDGNFALPPRTLLAFMFEILKGGYSEINEFVIFTTNLLAQVPGSAIPSFVWLSGFLSPETEIHGGAVRDIGMKWKAYHEAIAGEKFRSVGGHETQLFPI